MEILQLSSNERSFVALSVPQEHASSVATRLQRGTINKRIGIAEGKLEPPTEFEQSNDEIAVMFGVTP